MRPAQYVVPSLDTSSESESDVNKTRSNKLVDRQRRDRESSQSEDNIPLAELQNRIRSRQARLKYEDKHIPVEYDTSTESYFSDSESDDKSFPQIRRVMLVSLKSYHMRESLNKLTNQGFAP